MAYALFPVMGPTCGQKKFPGASLLTPNTQGPCVHDHRKEKGKKQLFHPANP